MNSSNTGKKSKRTYKWIIRLVGIFLFAYLFFFRIDLSNLGSLLKQIKLLPLFIAIVLAVPFILCKSIRWRIVLKDLSIPLSFGKTFSLYAIGLVTGYATPGQLGEFSKALFLKKLGSPYDTSLSSIFFDRVFDLFILLFLSLIGATVFRELFGGQVGIVIIFFIVISLFLILLASAKIRAGIGKRLGAILLPVKAKESLRNSSLIQRLEKLSLSRSTVFSAVLLSLIAYAIAFSRYYLLILSLNISIPFWPFLGCVTIASIVSILPISFAGIGTRDAVLIYLFSYLGLAQEAAISFSLLFLVMVLSNMVVGFFSWLKLSI